MLRFSIFTTLIAILIAAGTVNNCNAQPYQPEDAYKAAIEDSSTSPFIVLVEIIDDRTGQSSIVCTTSNLLLGAIYLEKWGNFDHAGTPDTLPRLREVRKMAAENTSHIFHFSSEAALKNIGLSKYDQACPAIAGGKRARVADRSGQVIFGPFFEGPTIIWETCPNVAYPLSVKPEGEGGATVSLIIDSKGTLKKNELTKSSGSPVLDKTILTVLSACQYKPRTVDDVPIAGEFPLGIMFGNRARWPFSKPGS